MDDGTAQLGENTINLILPFIRLASGLIMLASCSQVSQDKEEVEKFYSFDSYKANPNAPPTLAGAGGFLSYEEGCMFLEWKGGRTGLILPDSFQFDGKTLRNARRTMQLGEQVSFSRGFIDNPHDGTYACDSNALIFADDVYPTAPPPR